jgi:hypothetical protein
MQIKIDLEMIEDFDGMKRWTGIGLRQREGISEH